MTLASFTEFHQRSLVQREAFWSAQARLIDWQREPERICDDSRLPFVRWFPGGTTNLCHNAIDRHLPERRDQPALIAVSTEVNTERVYTYGDLHREVQAMAASLRALGVQPGDRVLLYMPMIAEAVFAMLACVRLGAIHSVVFGGFASTSLANRIDDAQPKVIVSADAGSRGGKVTAYKPMLDEALRLCRHQPASVMLVDRGLAPMNMEPRRDLRWTDLRASHGETEVPCAWVDSTHTSYTLYTSGTTGKPKGVQRDTGGYAVALAASMKHIFMGKPGETFFCTSDIGWVVGHSYIVYAPLINGMATILYEGLPTRPDPGVWWRLVQRFKVSTMFSAPTAVRVLRKQDSSWLQKADLSSLRALFLAGEPLDEPTAKWISESLGKPVVDNYWQTETGWPIMTIANGVEPLPTRLGSPGFPMYGYDVRLVDDQTGETLQGPGRKGVVMVKGPLPPGCMQTVWGDDDRFVKTYWTRQGEDWYYNTFDWGVRDEDGYYYILGRTDDVINVAGHRLGTREIEESISSCPGVAEVAVVGVADALKGQVAQAFVVPKDTSRLADAEARAAFEADVMRHVDAQIGAVGRPARVIFVSGLPKTRSGKLLRRAIAAVAEGRDPGDLTTMEDPAPLREIEEQLK